MGASDSKQKDGRSNITKKKEAEYTPSENNLGFALAGKW